MHVTPTSTLETLLVALRTKKSSTTTLNSSRMIKLIGGIIIANVLQPYLNPQKVPLYQVLPLHQPLSLHA